MTPWDALSDDELFAWVRQELGWRREIGLVSGDTYWLTSTGAAAMVWCARGTTDWRSWPGGAQASTERAAVQAALIALGAEGIVPKEPT